MKDQNICAHGYDKRFVHCNRCADPAFDAAKQPSFTVMTTTIGGAQPAADTIAKPQGFPTSNHVARLSPEEFQLIRSLADKTLAGSTFRKLLWQIEQLEAEIARLSAVPIRVETPAECGWFGEGRGKCLLKEGHRDEHTCEHDGRELRKAMLGLAAVIEAERRDAEKTGCSE